MKAVKGETYGVGPDATFKAVRELKTDWSHLEQRVVRSANLGAFRVKKGRGQRKNRQSKGVQHLRFGPIRGWFFVNLYGKVRSPLPTGREPSNLDFQHLRALTKAVTDSLTPREREVLAKRFPSLIPIEH